MAMGFEVGLKVRTCPECGDFGLVKEISNGVIDCGYCGVIILPTKVVIVRNGLTREILSVISEESTDSQIKDTIIDSQQYSKSKRARRGQVWNFCDETKKPRR